MPPKRIKIPLSAWDDDWESIADTSRDGSSPAPTYQQPQNNYSNIYSDRGYAQPSSGVSLERNRAIWEQANALPPAPAVPILAAPGAAPIIYKPELRILKRAVEEKPVETSKKVVERESKEEKERRYREARRRIFGDEGEKDGEDSEAGSTASGGAGGGNGGKKKGRDSPRNYSRQSNSNKEKKGTETPKAGTPQPTLAKRTESPRSTSTNLQSTTTNSGTNTPLQNTAVRAPKGPDKEGKGFAGRGRGRGRGSITGVDGLTQAVEALKVER